MGEAPASVQTDPEHTARRSRGSTNARQTTRDGRLSEIFHPSQTPRTLWPVSTAPQESGTEPTIHDTVWRAAPYRCHPPQSLR